MFGSNKKTSANHVGEVETIIGKNTIFKGNISGTGTIRIDGQFDGEIDTKGNIFVGETSKVTAQIKATNATVAGTIYGNVHISERLDLLSSAQIYGDLNVGVLSIAEGAVFKGACEMRDKTAHSIVVPQGKAAEA